MRTEQLSEGVTLYCGDCRDILPTLGKVDAVVTDPPYGIGADEAAAKNKGKWGWKDYGETQWDRDRPPPPCVFKAILDCSKEQVIWGGNYFTDFLPPSMRWLIWDKGQRDFSLADVEMAWTSQQKAARAFDYPRAKALNDGKQHPTQKPVEVMKWCLGFLPDARTILDPFMGSGTTGVACVQLGRKFTGIELDERYFDIACRRISDELKRPRLDLGEPVAKPVQEALI
jgi:DNA modification methylase